MLPSLIGIVKQNLSGVSGAKRRQDGCGEDGGVGQGAAVPCPASAHRDPGARIALRPDLGNHLNLPVAKAPESTANLIVEAQYSFSGGMKMRYAMAICLLATALPSAFSQTRLKFEVASVKPSDPDNS